MANAQTMHQPAAEGYQVAAGSVEAGSSIAPVNDTLTENHPHTREEVSHPYNSGTAPNAGLGAQSINGGTILQDENRERKKHSKCIVQ